MLQLVEGPKAFLGITDDNGPRMAPIRQDSMDSFKDFSWHLKVLTGLSKAPPCSYKMHAGMVAGESAFSSLAYLSAGHLVIRWHASPVMLRWASD